MNDELFSYAAALCARKECCRADISAKLRQRKAAPSDVESVISRLEREGFIDEERYARAFVRDKFRFDHWGRVKIRFRLLQKGIENCTADAALEEVNEEEYLAALLSFLRPRLSAANADNAREACQKAARAAASRGYEPHLVFRALEKLGADTE